MSVKTLPLAFLRAGSGAVVKDFHGGKGLHRRLMEMGLVHGARIRVLQNDRSGPLIISIGGEGRLAIGRGMALKIMVEEAN